MNIKNLTPGQSFTSADTRGTVYVVEGISTFNGLTVVDYRIDREFGKPYRGRFVRPSLSTVFVED